MKGKSKKQAEASSNKWNFTVIGPEVISLDKDFVYAKNLVFACITKDDKRSGDLIEFSHYLSRGWHLLGDLYDYLSNMEKSNNEKKASFSPLEVQFHSESIDFFPVFNRLHDKEMYALDYLRFPQDYRNSDSEASNTCPVLMLNKNFGLATFYAIPKRGYFDREKNFNNEEYSEKERDFKDQAEPQRANAYLTADNFILGAINLSFRISEYLGFLRRKTTKTYERIFASYSHKDKEIVEAIDSILNALNKGELIWDTKILKAGEDWEEGIKEEIKKADSFQLFWSENAKKSDHVKEEWKYALTLRRKQFIKPVFWEEPLAEPPEELEKIHFSLIKPITKTTK